MPRSRRLYTGARDLRCDSTQIINNCFWTDCQGPLATTTSSLCTGDSDYQTYRYDQDNGDWCSSTYDLLWTAPSDPDFMISSSELFVVPKERDSVTATGQITHECRINPGGIVVSDLTLFCEPQACAKMQTQVTQALEPPLSPEINPNHTGRSCDGVRTPPGYNRYFPYCCDPPSTYSDKLPVDPKYLFEHYYDTPADEVMWSYDDEYCNQCGYTPSSTRR